MKTKKSHFNTVSGCNAQQGVISLKLSLCISLTVRGMRLAHTAMHGGVKGWVVVIAGDDFSKPCNMYTPNYTTCRKGITMQCKPLHDNKVVFRHNWFEKWLSFYTYAYMQLSILVPSLGSSSSDTPELVLLFVLYFSVHVLFWEDLNYEGESQGSPSLGNTETWSQPKGINVKFFVNEPYHAFKENACNAISAWQPCYMYIRILHTNGRVLARKRIKYNNVP